MEKIIPRHVGFIMDGNGRWAKKRGMPRNFGHKKGADNVEKVVSHCFEKGVECISLYAFSTENWGRPEEEVSKIMELFYDFLLKYTKTLTDNGIRLKISGDKTKLSKKLIDLAESREELTKNYKKVLNLAINYGSRQELTSAVNTLIASGKTSVTEEDVKSALYTFDLPDIDLVIRTSGESRLSNFFLWQSAYAELYFTPVLWPDLSSSDIDEAFSWYESRNRRFGKL
ncbi:MAG: di-trans,poly-cis-decaprenylcistransferase [Clostridia bacterium]|nr:di-trans,poly-cis-decaprenylcistransferase [Clostridia bacterium]